MNASVEEKCDGCRHRNTANAGGWCYLFDRAPSSLPCGQHDKFTEQCTRNGKAFIAVLMGDS